MYVTLALGLLTLWVVSRYWKTLSVPGPRAFPFIGNLLQIDRFRPFLTFQTWHRKYQGTYRIQLPDGERLVVTDYDQIYEVLVSRGLDFAGRCTYWRGQYAYKGQGIGQSHEPDDKWRALRKLTHAHIRQYGDVSGPLNDALNSISEKMFSKFEATNTAALDPRRIISRTVLKTLTLLVVGKELTRKDQIHHKIKEYVSMAFENVSEEANWRGLLLDRFPWLRHFHVSTFSKVHKVKVLDKEIWNEIKNIVHHDEDTPCLGRSLVNAVKYPARLKSAADVSISDFHAQRTALSVLLAGVGTTTMTLYALVNILATHPEVQVNIRNEISQVLGVKSRKLTIQDQSKMPYSRATILELLRYTSIAAFGMSHKTLKDTKVGTVNVPKNTSVITNLWGLHHNDSFWDEPHRFKPGRFLDLSGRLVPADHAHRTHLLPFGAGPRVCLGEGLVQTRLFVWLVNLCHRMEIKPSDPNNVVDSDPRKYMFDCGLLKHPPYTVRFIKRK